MFQIFIQGRIKKSAVRRKIEVKQNNKYRKLMLQFITTYTTKCTVITNFSWIKSPREVISLGSSNR